MVLEFEQNDLLSLDDNIFDAIKFEDGFPKELSWEEGPSGLESTLESLYYDATQTWLDSSKPACKEDRGVVTGGLFANEFEHETSNFRASEPDSSPSSNLLTGGWSEQSLDSCLKTDVLGRKHYHGLYALDAVEKSFSLSPAAGLWSHTTHSRPLEQDSLFGNDLATTGSSQSRKMPTFSTATCSQNISDLTASPFLSYCQASKRLKNTVVQPRESFTHSTSTSYNNCQQSFSSITPTDSQVFPVYVDTSNCTGVKRKFRVPDLILSPSLESQIKRRPQRKKQYSRVSPAKFCHLCARASNKNIRMVVCSNIQIGMCLKVTCEKCFQQNGWNFEEAFENPKTWICSHCRGSCPFRAQCSIYQRTNHRRRVSRFLMRKQRESSEEYE